MKVALLAGPSLAGRCGVSDYTSRLALALQAKGVDADVVNFHSWRLHSAVRIRAYLKRSYDLVHIQYPTAAFGTRLAPQGLALLQPCVITLHEASNVHILRQVALLPFTIRPQHLIFTSHFEREFAMRWMPRVSQFSSVIPIGSNIGVGMRDEPLNLAEIVYFGLIMPKKGLEDVVKLAEIIKSRGLSFKIRILGSVPPKHVQYCEVMQAKTATLPIIWDCGLNEQQVARKLAASSIAYLPYPDGASERRATLSAVALNGVAVITTRGLHTPPQLENAVMFCKDPEEALAAATFLASTPEARARLVNAADAYAKQFSWERIVDLHRTLYLKLLSPSGERDGITLRNSRDEEHFVQN